jgi:hypothetical protein
MQPESSSRRHFLRQSALSLGGIQLGLTTYGSAAEAKVAPHKERFNHYEDARLITGEPAAIAPGSFTIVALPDTQKYAKVNPEGFLAQTEWITKNAQARNIAGVIHLGDITDNNLPAQWELAVKAMQKLDGVVPYFLVPGNHDYSENGVCKDRKTLINDYFKVSDQQKRPSFGGVYDKEPDHLENSYHLLTIGDKKLLILCLEFGPRKDVVRWANEVVAKHKDHAAILATHAYMYFDDTRYDQKKYGDQQVWNPHKYAIAAATGDDVNDGEELWQNLVSKQSNFIMTLNGHVLNDGLGRISTKAPDEREIHQMLFNCQMRPNGGDSWLRLIEFKADGTASICDYAPQLDKRNEAEENKFTLKVAPVA